VSSTTNERDIELERQAAELHRQGAKVPQIAKILGKSERSIHRWLARKITEFKQSPR